MSKNLFRKGLVVAAISGLASTAIAGAPAFAAGEIQLKPTSGTSYNTFVTEQISLAASLTSGYVPGDWSQLAYQITTDGVATIQAKAASDAVAATAITNSKSTADVSVDATTKVGYITETGTTSGSTYNAVTLNVKNAVASTPSTTVKVTAFIDADNSGTLNDADTWRVAQDVTFKKYSTVTANTAVTQTIVDDATVVAKISYNDVNNEQLTAALAGAKFTKADGSALITAATALTPTAAAVSSNVATFTLTNTGTAIAVGDVVTVAGFGATTAAEAVLNGTFSVLTASTTAITVRNVTGNVAATAFGTVTENTNTLTGTAWSAVDSFKYTATPASPLVKDEGVKVQPVFNGSSVGTAATVLNTAHEASGISTNVVSSITAIATTTGNSTGSVAGVATSAANKAFQVYAKVLDVATTPVALPNKAVTVSITSAALPATAAAAAAATDPATLTVAGVTYTNQAALPGATGVAALAAVTNVDGKVILDVSSTNYAGSAQTIVFTFKTENFSAALTVTPATAAPANAFITNYEGNAAAVAPGTSVSVNIAAFDQFGAPIADKYDARAIWASSSRTVTNTDATTAAVVVPVVAGKATLTLPDAGAGTGTAGWTLKLTQRSTTAGGYTGSDYPVQGAWAAGSTTFTVNYKAAADLVAGVVVLKDSSAGTLSLNVAKTKYVYTAAVLGGSGNKAALSTADFGAYDARSVVGTIPAPGVTGVGLNGIVKSLSTPTYAGVAVPGTTVTIASAGLQFKSSQGGADVWATDSITVNADASGVFAVTAYSHIAGIRTVTVTSGSATSVVDLYFDDAATTAGTVVAVTPLVTDLQSGSGVTFGATVVDKFGNAVAPNQANATGAAAYFSLKFTDLSGISTTVYALTADAGSLNKAVNFGMNDKGTVTVVATYDADGVTATKAAVVKTVTFNVSDLAKAAADAAAKAAADAAAAAAKAAAIDSMVVSVVTTSQVGRAVDVSVTAKNAAGAAAVGQTVTFTSTGAGSLSALTAVTDANGVATVKLVAGTQDLGTGVVVATANGKSVTGKVDFGQTDASVDIIGKRVYVTTEFAAGKRVTIYDNGVRRYSAIQTTDAEKVVMWNVKSGSHTIVVKISGASSDAVTFLVK